MKSLKTFIKESQSNDILLGVYNYVHADTVAIWQLDKNNNYKFEKTDKYVPRENIEDVEAFDKKTLKYKSNNKEYLISYGVYQDKEVNEKTENREDMSCFFDLTKAIEKFKF